MQRSVVLLFLGALTLACKSPSTGDTESDGSSSSTASTGITGVDPSTTTPDPTTGAASTGSTEPDVSGTGTQGETLGMSSEGGSTDDLTTNGGVCVPLECDGGLYACGDCMDNDGDGKVDTADPECVSPCDDREDTFATGLPGDNMDPCKQDCFFDGNSGGGKGDCAWNLACDMKNPGGDKCPYDPNKDCPEEQSDECINTCKVPNGCDCFGCCTVEVDGMEYDIYLGDETCSLADIATCEECTPNEDCDEECHPEDCEVCFGQDLPDGCDDPTCDVGMPCEVDDMGGSNCPPGEFCGTGCCQPIQPG